MAYNKKMRQMEKSGGGGYGQGDIMGDPSNYKNIYGLSNAINPPIERGGLAVQNRYDFIRDMWGIPESLTPYIEDIPNMQPLDLIAHYKNREVQQASTWVTAATLNARAGWLSQTASPIYPTAELNFTTTYSEINCIKYDRTAAGGIPNQQTYRETQWSDKSHKVQLNAVIELDLALDPTFGRQRWVQQLAGLASNAMLTVHTH